MIPHGPPIGSRWSVDANQLYIFTVTGLPYKEKEGGRYLIPMNDWNNQSTCLLLHYFDPKNYFRLRRIP